MRLPIEPDHARCAGPRLHHSTSFFIAVAVASLMVVSTVPQVAEQNLSGYERGAKDHQARQLLQFGEAPGPSPGVPAASAPGFGGAPSPLPGKGDIPDALLFSGWDFNGTKGVVPFNSQGSITQFGISDSTDGGLSSVILPGGTCLFLSNSDGFRTTVAATASFFPLVEGLGRVETANNNRATHIAYYAQMAGGLCGLPPAGTPGPAADLIPAQVLGPALSTSFAAARVSLTLGVQYRSVTVDSTAAYVDTLAECYEKCRKFNAAVGNSCNTFYWCGREEGCERALHENLTSTISSRSRQFGYCLSDYALITSGGPIIVAAIPNYTYEFVAGWFSDPTKEEEMTNAGNFTQFRDTTGDIVQVKNATSFVGCYQSCIDANELVGGICNEFSFCSAPYGCRGNSGNMKPYRQCTLAFSEVFEDQGPSLGFSPTATTGSGKYLNIRQTGNISQQ